MSAISSTPPREVFLSHSTPDRRIADRISQVLRAHGVPVWYSRVNIVGAQQWHDEIGQALRRCDTFIILLSERSIKSKWVRHELMYALREKRYEDRIVPLLIRRCDPSTLSWTLPAFQIINFARNFEEGSRQLLKIGIGLHTTTPLTPKPRKRRKRRD